MARAGLLAALAPGLFVEADPQKLHLELVGVGGLGRGDGGQEPGGGVQDPVGVVTGERFLVGPAVPVLPEFAHEAPLGVSEDAAEELVPLLRHELQERGDVPLGNRLLRSFGRCP